MMWYILETQLLVPLFLTRLLSRLKRLSRARQLCIPRNLRSSYLESRTCCRSQLGLYRQPSVLAGEAVEQLSGIGEGVATARLTSFGKSAVIITSGFSSDG